MTDYTAHEIEEAVEAITDWASEENEWLGESASAIWGELKYGAEIKSGLLLRGERVPVEKIASHGGMGQGDEIWVVVKVGDQLFQKDVCSTPHALWFRLGR